MKNAKLVWTTLAACALLIAGAMGWFTWKVRSLEHDRALAEARADLGERIRLALWRMDTAGAAIILRENRYPPTAYRNGESTPAANAPVSRLAGISPFVSRREDSPALLHFELDARGVLQSPETGEVWSQSAGIPPEILAERKARFARLKTLLGDKAAREDARKAMPGEWSMLRRAASIGESARRSMPKNAQKDTDEINVALRQKKGAAKARRSVIYQSNSYNQERMQRAKAVEQTLNNSQIAQQDEQTLAPQQQQAPAPRAATGGARRDADKSENLPQGQAAEPPTDNQTQPQPTSQGLFQLGETSPSLQPVDVRPMHAVWIGKELFLLRLVKSVPPGETASRAIQTTIQGVWLDSAALERQLLAEVSDLLPAASLVRISGNGKLAGLAAEDPLALVSFPFRLDPGESPAAAPAGLFPLGAPLLVGWAAVLFALAATALLVRGVVRLSERRAAFVSSVTHELRTPLTTFRLYSDLLAEGMIPEGKKRTDYLRTMRTEADRLHHLVENVLAYSRIERGSARARRERIALGDLLERMKGRLDERAAAEDMHIDIECGPDCQTAVLDTDVTAVEQILFNLVDNACKYGRTDDDSGDSGDPAIHISAEIRGSRALVRVRDHGPGIAASDAARMFRAFHKSAAQAAAQKPGVGLGLALSRRLARALGGNLSLANPGHPGAEFLLDLPVSDCLRCR